MKSINRMAVVIKPKQPFIDWINSMPGDSSNYTIEQIAKNNLTFLVPEYDNTVSTMNYIKKKYKIIFEWELWGWITDEELWPEKRNWKMFNEWFDIEISSEVFDMVDLAIEKEEL